MNERILLMRLKHKNERALTEVIERYTAYVTTIIRNPYLLIEFEEDVIWSRKILINSNLTLPVQDDTNESSIVLVNLLRWTTKRCILFYMAI